jgi:hypothetical protein
VRSTCTKKPVFHRTPRPSPSLPPSSIPGWSWYAASASRDVSRATRAWVNPCSTSSASSAQKFSPTVMLSRPGTCLGKSRTAGRGKRGAWRGVREEKRSGRAQTGLQGDPLALRPTKLILDAEADHVLHQRHPCSVPFTPHTRIHVGPGGGGGGRACASVGRSGAGGEGCGGRGDGAAQVYVGRGEEGGACAPGGVYPSEGGCGRVGVVAGEQADGSIVPEGGDDW